MRAKIAAAGLVILAGAATWAVWRPVREPGVSMGAAGHEFVTARGQRMAFRLPDGSSIVLGPASRLQLLGKFGVRDRRVMLVGEGAFTVSHDAARPFTVYTARGVAKDLGTRFDVREYGEDSSMTVVVAEGVVHLQGRAGQRGAGVTLRPGQLGQVESGEAITLGSNVDLDRYFAWTDGRLVFRDTPLGTAVAQLARWYDVEIRLASPALVQRHLTASVKNDSPADVLAMVAVSLKLDLEVSGAGRVFTLRAR